MAEAPKSDKIFMYYSSNWEQIVIHKTVIIKMDKSYVKSV